MTIRMTNRSTANDISVADLSRTLYIDCRYSMISSAVLFFIRKISVDEIQKLKAYCNSCDR